MNWYGSGFIPIIIYSLGKAAEEEDFALLTENDLDILTESSQRILTESA